MSIGTMRSCASIFSSPHTTQSNMKTSNRPSNGGVMVRHNNEWHFLLDKGKLQDFGGKKADRGESFEDCAWRECFGECGLKLDDAIKVLHVFDEQSYGVIVVMTNKAPYAKEPNTSIVRYANYVEARRTNTLNGRLFIKGFEHGLKEFEGTSSNKQAPAFILDVTREVETSEQIVTVKKTTPRTTHGLGQTSRTRRPTIMDMPSYVDCSTAGSYIRKKPAFI